MGSMWGKYITISVFGESHGPAIGVVIDGLPSGVTIDMDEVDVEMKRRAPGNGQAGSTPRKESDEPMILSGLLNNVTEGTPLAVMIPNDNTKSKDYEALSATPRPGHADLSGLMRYCGCHDMRGSGHFSGRLTAPIVFAGAIAKQILATKGVVIRGHVLRIGDISDTPWDGMSVPEKKFNNPDVFPVDDVEQGEKMQALITAAREDGDSVGGVIQVLAGGMPAGLGNPIFENIESIISSIMFAIPAVKGVSFGDGFDVASHKGSENNDSPCIVGKSLRMKTNHAGGIDGGISTGMPIVVNVAMKPTPSIAKEQETVTLETMKNTTIKVLGRHDACIVVRALPVVEAALAIALLDIVLQAEEKHK